MAKKLFEIVTQLQDVTFCDNRKIAFIAEQLSLPYVKPNGRRYSSSLLAMAYMWQSISPATYRQIVAGDVLTLPAARYVRSLVSAVGNDLKLTEPAEECLSSRFSKLKDRDTTVTLLMDEVHCQKSVNYSNGKFFGLENNEVSKTLLCLMIKSVSGKYRDVIYMTPISNINDEKLYIAWDNSVKVLTSIGFDVVATMTDGHLSNLKLFRRLLKCGDNHFSISNPYSLDKKIFLLFDTVHLFKNMWKNFLKYLIFEYPKFPVKDCR